MNKSHYYRLPVDSKLGQKLSELYRRGAEAINASAALSEELKAEEFTTSQGFAAGGIGCLLFRRKPSAKKYDMVERVDKLYACVPNSSTKEGKEILARMAALPVVRINEVCEAFGFDYRNDNFKGHSMPNFFRVEEEWDYVKTDYPLYIEGMQPILEAEFERAYKYVKEE